MILIILIVVMILLLSSKESMFGFSGYKKPVDVDISEGVPDLTGWSLMNESVTRDEINTLVSPAVNFFKDKTGLCVFPIETNLLEKYSSMEDTSPLYKVRFMFSTTSTGFPYGIGCTFYIKDGTVVGAQTQQLPSTGTVKPYTEDYGVFLPYDTIVSERNKRILSLL